jgi:hypothetical protein
MKTTKNLSHGGRVSKRAPPEKEFRTLAPDQPIQQFATLLEHFGTAQIPLNK